MRTAKCRLAHVWRVEPRSTLDGCAARRELELERKLERGHTGEARPDVCIEVAGTYTVDISGAGSAAARSSDRWGDLRDPDASKSTARRRTRH